MFVNYSQKPRGSAPNSSPLGRPFQPAKLSDISRATQPDLHQLTGFTRPLTRPPRQNSSHRKTIRAHRSTTDQNPPKKRKFSAFSDAQGGEVAAQTDDRSLPQQSPSAIPQQGTQASATFGRTFSRVATVVCEFVSLPLTAVQSAVTRTVGAVLQSQYSPFKRQRITVEEGRPSRSGRRSSRSAKLPSQSRRRLSERPHRKAAAEHRPVAAKRPSGQTAQLAVFPPPVVFRPKKTLADFFPAESRVLSTEEMGARQSTEMKLGTAPQSQNQEGMMSPPTSPVEVGIVADVGPAMTGKTEAEQDDGTARRVSAVAPAGPPKPLDKSIPPAATTTSLGSLGLDLLAITTKKKARKPKAVSFAAKSSAPETQPQQANYPFFAKYVWTDRNMYFDRVNGIKIPKAQSFIPLRDSLMSVWFDEPAKSGKGHSESLLVALYKLSGDYPPEGIEGSVMAVSRVRVSIEMGVYMLVTIPDHSQHATTKEFVQYVDRLYAEQQREPRPVEEQLLQNKVRLDQSRLGSVAAMSRTEPPQSEVRAWDQKLQRQSETLTLTRAEFVNWPSWVKRRPKTESTVTPTVPSVEPEQAERKSSVAGEPADRVDAVLDERTRALTLKAKTDEIVLLDESDEEPEAAPVRPVHSGARSVFAKAGGHIIGPLPTDWARKLDAILAGQNPHAPVVGPIARRDLGTLCPTGSIDSQIGWLNDEVINSILNHLRDALQEIHVRKSGSDSAVPSVQVLSSFWYKQVTDKGVESTARWLKRAKIDSDRLAKVRHLFIPVNPGGHWMLLHLSPQAKLVEHYDSMNGSPAHYLDLARQLVLFHLAGTDGFNIDDWSFRRGTSNLQGNCNDCGVFTVWNAIALALDRTPAETVAQRQMPDARRLAAAVLINGGFKGDFAL